MTLRSDLIPSFLQGVSQQPDAQRDPSQGELQVNFMSSLGEGLRKREGTRPIKRVSTSGFGDAVFHQIQRDAAEQYLVVISRTAIRVFDLQGNERAVTAASGAFSYLSTAANARADIRAATIADVTFISNLKVSPAMLDALAPETPRPAAFEALVWVRAANYGQTYRVTVNGQLAQVQTNVQPVAPSGAENRISTAEIAAQIRGLLLGGAVTTLSVVGSSTTLNGTVTGVAATTDEGGSGLSVNVTGNGAVVTAVAVSGASSRGYRAGDAVFVARNLLQGGTDTTPVRVATVLAAAAGPLTGVSIARAGSVLHLTSANSFTITAADARANADITAITDTVQAFTDLPTVAPQGYPVEVTGDPTNQFDAYHLLFRPRSSAGLFGEGEWEEAPAAGVKYRLDPLSMPHLLVRLPSGDFWFGPANGSVQGGFTIPTWGNRTAGDEDSAPAPPMVGAPVQDVCVFGNRLAVLADESVGLSRARQYFDHFPETVTTVLDSDPIDVSSPDAERVSVLRFAVPYQNELIAFSDQLVFRLYSNDTVLSPRTAQLAVLTAVELDAGCRPIPVQGEIVFVQGNGQFSRIRNFSIKGAGTAIIGSTGDLTEQAASYIPSGVVRLAQSDSANIILALSAKPGHEDKIYVYKYFLRGEERVQSSFSTWHFAAAKILDIICVKEILYLLVQYGDEVWLEQLSVSDRISDASPSPYPFLLDRAVSTTSATPAALRVATGAYNPITNTTTWSLPFQIRAATQAWSDYDATTNGGVLLGEAASGSQITARGDWASNAPPVWFGEVIDARYRPSRPKIQREQAGGGRVTANLARVSVRSFAVRYEQTRFFRVVCQAEGRDPVQTTFDGTILASRDSALGSTLPAEGFPPGVFSGVLRVPIHSRNDRCSIEIQNDSPHPSAFLSGEWTGVVTSRARPLR